MLELRTPWKRSNTSTIYEQGRRRSLFGVNLKGFLLYTAKATCFYAPVNEIQGYEEITLSVRRSVRLSASVSFDIGIPYLAHRSITMRGCVKYIHDPDTTLNFDLKIKFLGFMTWLCVQASVFFLPLT